MFLDLTDNSNHSVYSYLVGGISPRPIAWVSTLSEEGVANIAPYSFFTVASCNPPVLSVTQVNPRDNANKDTLNNLLATKECVVNIVSHSLVEQMNQSCADYPRDVSEFDAANIQRTPSQLVSVPSVAASKVRYECKLREVITISDEPSGGQMMLLDVVGIFLDDTVLVNGYIDPTRLDAVGKMGGDYFSTTKDKFALKRPQL
ncbi:MULTISPECIES: flavin reductase family protein [unclassified Pseudoalteromonas]|jgi:flavin reductase (DIM6/NTAB) family NADH-FMN oxidoreductase RutF|uniref:flavin reductase family protein n=1 Tax=unclassified Pseudoalteromonas TaxID=194690 RepID=UPI0007E4E468|nr:MULTISPECIES: flavin reductase family protein [unclassified Pseudoalteromonas]MDN3394759.1 flavin reductase family protein [Pseudoalteromonas sp. APC 3215]MDN3402880.1 flavin reductase family protein [Pseudoalteromonas sp. APC 3213]MDN3430812.1 flavin reductase family protein [Pseudoalteromonas sp. APC 3907]MDN3463961.1 flavin reductase family protein [Pseudoalteromonas sp. APC 3495]MDN3471037.1 flavin reductase family protein [Pseudoalteromonas sp. APC 4026]